MGWTQTVSALRSEIYRSLITPFRLACYLPQVNFRVLGFILLL